jgi:hypothetical protein
VKNTTARELRSRLNLSDSALKFLESLPAADAAMLGEAILRADDHQRRHVNAAVEHAARYVPAPLRGIVRKLLLD